MAGQFPDGQLYVNLRGYAPDQPMTAGDALARFLTALGVAGPDVPFGLDERAGRYRGEVAGRRLLIVLDNAASVEQVRPLLPGAGSCTVLVTSRSQLAGLVALDGARRLDLDPLPPTDANALLRQLIGARSEAEPEATAALAELCARLPLALRVAAELAVARPMVALADLADELADRQRRLDLLDASGDPRAAVAEVFSWSVQHLPPAAARTFRLFGLHPGPDADSYATAALTGADRSQARHDLEVLARANLIQATAAGRYGMHDLLKAYAARLTTASDSDAHRRAVRDRLYDYYIASAAAAMDAAYPYEREHRPQVPPAPTPGPELSDPAAALAWLDTELPSLLAVARSATEPGRPAHRPHLSTILHRHLRTRGRYSDAEALHQQALDTAGAADDQTGQLDALNGLGDIHLRRGRHRRAAGDFERALKVARVIGHRTGQLTALNGLGMVHLQQGRHEQAAGHFERALKVARATGHRTGELDALNGLGHIRRRQGRHEQAADHFEQVLQVARTTGHRTGHMTALASLGWVRLMQGRYEPAADHYQEGLQIARDTGNRIGELTALNGLGFIHRLQGRHEQATDHYQEALQIARDTGHRTGQLNALAGLGHIHRLQGRYTQAADHYQRLLDLAREGADRNWQFEAWQGLGRLDHATGHPDTAIPHHEQALTLAAELSQPLDQARAHDGLAHAHHALGQHEPARTHWRQALHLLTDLGSDHTEDEETTTAAIRAHLATFTLPATTDE